jgi:Ca-activated chloride channel family protein
MSLDFASPLWLLALWVLPLIAGGALWAGVLSRRALARFVESKLIERMAPGASLTGALMKAGVLVASIALVIVALARPQWGVEERELPRAGRDVVFLIDVSRSMLTEDVRPNRLKRAKLWVDDAIRAMPANRVAVVAFAGSTVVKSPLTLDHGFARLALAELSPEAVARGGTNLGDALRLTAREVFDLSADDALNEARTRDIIVISDGGDQESLPQEAAAALAAQDVRIIAIGVGDEDSAHPIPIDTPRGRQYVEYQGERVLTRLESDVLRQTALASAGGVYLGVGSGAVELADVYADLSRDDPRIEFDAAERERRREQFQWFLVPAIALLVIEAAMIGRRGKGALP